MNHSFARITVHVACAIVVIAAPTISSAAEQDTVVINGQRASQEKISDNGALGSRQLLDTPFSVTVVDADDIARRQANSVAQIFINDPSVFSASTSATTNWWGAQVRGMGVRNYYIDGVPMDLTWGGEYPLEPIETVEVLKGLTGFMYGFGTPGGVLEYQTKKPTDQALLSTSLGYRNDGVFFGSIDAGGRLADGNGLGYRLNLGGEFGDAYNSAGVNRSIVSLALDYRLRDNVTWYGNSIYEDSKLEHEPLYFYWDSYTGDSLPDPTYDYKNVSIRNSFYEYQTLNTTTGLKLALSSSWNANVSVGYSRKEHYSNKMFAYLLNEAGDYEGAAYNFSGDLKNYVGQALVDGRFETGLLRHEVVLGANYRRSTGQWGNDWYWNNDFNGNLYQPQPFVVTRDIDFSFAPISEDERQSAAFVSDTVHVGDRWQAILGARYTDYELMDLDGDPTVDSSYDTNEVSPTVALIYNPVANVSLYGSYVESMEGGGRVGEMYANFGELLGATVSRQYEVGAKYEQDRLSFTSAAFRVERAAQIDELRDGLRYLTQDGLTLYDGIEAIASLAATNYLRVGFGATWLDASIDDVSPENEHLLGNRPAGAAKWQVVGNADYRVPSVPGLSVHGSVRYFGDAYYDDANAVLIPHRTLANLGFQYRTNLSGRSVSFTGNVNNLFNEKYWELNTLGEGINASLGMKVDW